jgi:hypothetical protein
MRERLREDSEGEVDRTAAGAEPACEAEIRRRLGKEPGVDTVETELAELLSPPAGDDLLLGLDHLDLGFDQDVRHVPETGDRPKEIRPVAFDAEVP